MEIFLFFKAIWAGISIDQMCIFALALYCSHQTRMITKLQYQYNQLDKLMMSISIVLHLKMGVKLTQDHRTGDYDLYNPMLDNPNKVPDWNVNEAHRQEIKRLKKYLSKRELMADYFEDNRAKKTEKE